MSFLLSIQDSLLARWGCIMSAVSSMRMSPRFSVEREVIAPQLLATANILRDDIAKVSEIINPDFLGV